MTQRRRALSHRCPPVASLCRARRRAQRCLAAAACLTVLLDRDPLASTLALRDGTAHGSAHAAASRSARSFAGICARASTGSVEHDSAHSQSATPAAARGASPRSDSTLGAAPPSGSCAACTPAPLYLEMVACTSSSHEVIAGAASADWGARFLLPIDGDGGGSRMSDACIRLCERARRGLRLRPGTWESLDLDSAAALAATSPALKWN